MLDAAEEIKGIRETVTFRGESLDALFYDVPLDLQPIGGGDANAALCNIAVRLADVDLPITHLEPITIRGQELVVHVWDDMEGRLDITAGDPAYEVER